MIKNKVDKKYLYKINNSPLAMVSPNLAQPPAVDKSLGAEFCALINAEKF
ncbi:hypothetical protein [Anabaena catenula]|uniref:Uncharacterized protein n=1 Tax=Anabaena catenula FACHB-362 TaxID=2692877 RepID=A0ABR8IW71_9NOST|nr:hypothetical protein [Anabaena catenula]MBD2690310.1 hypothetical protein [Anabaena catenula FACHB-362]